MKFTPTQIKILQKARSRIALGQEKYICFAIEHAGKILKANKPAQQLKRHIQQLIEPGSRYSRYGCMSLETWLKRNCYISVDYLDYETMREYRLRWIDHMIQEYS